MTSVVCVYVSWYTHWVNVYQKYISFKCKCKITKNALIQFYISIVKSYKIMSINKLTNHTITYEI